MNHSPGWAMGGGEGGLTVGVLGATGAIGAEVVALLSRSAAVGGVVAMTRRERGVGGFPGVVEGKPVTERVVRFGNLQPADLAGLDAVVCCLGTTSADAGGAAQRHVVDHDYVLEAARLARADPKCHHFALVTSTGSNSKSFLSYARTKGMAEEGVIALGFPRTSIWRPGLLDRGGRARGVEKVGLALAGGLPVRAVASAIVSALEQENAGGAGARSGADEKGTSFFSDAEIRRLAREAGVQPTSPPSCSII